jgi:hypothetical protein
MTKEEIERYIARLDRMLLANIYPVDERDEELFTSWRQHHDYCQRDIERLEFILKRLPPAPHTQSVKPFPSI